MHRIFLILAFVAAAMIGASEAYASAEAITAASALAPMAPFATVAAAVAAGRLPRALLHAGVRANADPAAMLREITANVTQMKADQKLTIDGVQASLDDMNKRFAALQAGAGDISAVQPVDPAYTRTFAGYMRSGREEHELQNLHASGERAVIRAAMSTGSQGDGGYLAPVEWDRKINQALKAKSILRTLCRVIGTTTAGYQTVWNNNLWGSGWVGETASRPATTTPSLSPILFKAGEIYANPAITQNLLDDANFNIEEWLSASVDDEFSAQEAVAFVSGDGVNKPQGFLSYIGTGTNIHPGGEPVVALSGSAAAVSADSLIDLVYGLAAPYRANAGFLMNSVTQGSLRKLKDNQGNYLWQPSLIVGQPPTLLGYPVYSEESMPAVAAGNLPIAFGDWSRFYVINDRAGTSVLRDPFTAKPYVQFYTRKRVGGGILDPRAVRFMKVGTA